MENLKSYEKVYRCPKCGGIGKNQRMVEHVLDGSCDGKLTRKLREAERDSKYVGMEAEAELNTQLLFKEEAVKELRQSYQEMKKAIEDDILEIKEINEGFLADAYSQYFTQIY